MPFRPDDGVSVGPAAPGILRLPQRHRLTRPQGLVSGPEHGSRWGVRGVADRGRIALACSDQSAHTVWQKCGIDVTSRVRSTKQRTLALHAKRLSVCAFVKCTERRGVTSPTRWARSVDPGLRHGGVSVTLGPPLPVSLELRSTAQGISVHDKKAAGHRRHARSCRQKEVKHCQGVRQARQIDAADEDKESLVGRYARSPRATRRGGVVYRGASVLDDRTHRQRLPLNTPAKRT